MTGKHTPGPWHLHVTDYGSLSILAADGGYVSDIGYGFGEVGAEEHAELVVDHTLMAAAPDLLAACEAARETCDAEGDHQTRDLCDAAIAKARGA